MFKRAEISGRIAGGKETDRPEDSTTAESKLVAKTKSEITLSNYKLRNVDAVGYDDGEIDFPVAEKCDDGQVLDDIGPLTRHKKGYSPKFPCISEWLETLADNKRLAVMLRLEGKTLQAIGEEMGLTRERVRQLVDNACQTKPRLREDDFAYWYSKYKFDDGAMESIFGTDVRIRNYLSLVYKKGTDSIIKMLDDPNLDATLYERVYTYLYRNSDLIEYESVPYERELLSQEVAELASSKRDVHSQNVNTVNWYSSSEKIISRLEKQKESTRRCCTKKPHLPSTKECKRVSTVPNDKKVVRPSRIKSKPKKIKESEFAPIIECFDADLTDYCAFWCAEAFSLSPTKGIYQIAAVKVRNGEITEKFQELIRPWDDTRSRKDAAKKVGVELSVIESAEDVDQVMTKFFAFVGDDVLVATGALGNQAKLISRAARYTGMKEIKNEFFDLLDMAADISEEFDLANNTREYLLDHFFIKEGKTALEKAMINKQLYDALRSEGGLE